MPNKKSCPDAVSDLLVTKWKDLNPDEQALIRDMCGGKFSPEEIAEAVRRQRLKKEIGGCAKNAGVALTEDELLEALEDCLAGTPVEKAVDKIKDKQEAAAADAAAAAATAASKGPKVKTLKKR